MVQSTWDIWVRVEDLSAGRSRKFHSKGTTPNLLRSSPEYLSLIALTNLELSTRHHCLTLVYQPKTANLRSITKYSPSKRMETHWSPRFQSTKVVLPLQNPVASCQVNNPLFYTTTEQVHSHIPQPPWKSVLNKEADPRRTVLPMKCKHVTDPFKPRVDYRIVKDHLRQGGHFCDKAEAEVKQLEQTDGWSLSGRFRATVCKCVMTKLRAAAGESFKTSFTRWCWTCYEETPSVRHRKRKLQKVSIKWQPQKYWRRTDSSCVRVTAFVRRKTYSVWLQRQNCFWKFVVPGLRNVAFFRYCTGCCSPQHHCSRPYDIGPSHMHALNSSGIGITCIAGCGHV